MPTQREELRRLIAVYENDIMNLEEREEDLLRRIDIMKNLIPTVLVWYMWKASQANKTEPFPQSLTEEEANKKLQHLQTVLEELKAADATLKEEETVMRKRIQELEDSLRNSFRPIIYTEQSEIENIGIEPTVKPVFQDEVATRDDKIKILQMKQIKFKELLEDSETDWKYTCERLFEEVDELNKLLADTNNKLKESEQYIEQLEKGYTEKDGAIKEKIEDLEEQTKLLFSEVVEKEEQRDQEDREVIDAVKETIEEVNLMKQTLSKGLDKLEVTEEYESTTKDFPIHTITEDEEEQEDLRYDDYLSEQKIKTSLPPPLNISPEEVIMPGSRADSLDSKQPISPPMIFQPVETSDHLNILKEIPKTEHLPEAIKPDNIAADGQVKSLHSILRVKSVDAKSLNGETSQRAKFDTESKAIEESDYTSDIPVSLSDDINAKVPVDAVVISTSPIELLPTKPSKSEEPLTSLDLSDINKTHFEIDKDDLVTKIPHDAEHAPDYPSFKKSVSGTALDLASPNVEIEASSALQEKVAFPPSMEVSENDVLVTKVPDGSKSPEDHPITSLEKNVTHTALEFSSPNVEIEASTAQDNVEFLPSMEVSEKDVLVSKVPDGSESPADYPITSLEKPVTDTTLELPSLKVDTEATSAPQENLEFSPIMTIPENDVLMTKVSEVPQLPPDHITSPFEENVLDTVPETLKTIESETILPYSSSTVEPSTSKLPVTEKTGGDASEAQAIISEPFDTSQTENVMQPTTPTVIEIEQGTTGVRKRPSVESLTAQTLQSKCRVKDHLIRSMADQLRELARKNIWSGNKLLTNLSSDPVKTYDFDRNTLCQYLKGEEPKNFTPSLKSNEAYSSSNPLGVKVIRKLDENTLLIEWGPPPSDEVVGFQIFINGEFMYWVHSAKRNIALLNPLDLKSQLDITVSPINSNGDIIYRSSIIYNP